MYSSFLVIIYAHFIHTCKGEDYLKKLEEDSECASIDLGKKNFTFSGSLFPYAYYFKGNRKTINLFILPLKCLIVKERRKEVN